MPRLALSPADSFRRQDEALRLLGVGHGVRAVARIVGCSPASVVRWRDADAAARAAGHDSLPRRWDVHGTAGARWEATAAKRRRDATTREQSRVFRRRDSGGGGVDASVARHLHMELQAQRHALLSGPAPWDDNPLVAKRAAVRLGMDAQVVTRGAVSSWTSEALGLLFGIEASEFVDVTLFPNPEERAQVARMLLERSARDAGFVQDGVGVWHLPS